MKTAAELAAVLVLASYGNVALAQDVDTQAFKAADMEMMKNMDSAPYTGNADVDFRLHMIPHHEGAIAMARVALKYAKDVDTKRLAQNIIDSQEKQVAGMQTWLRKHGH